jgi:hypothetical protein
MKRDEMQCNDVAWQRDETGHTTTRGRETMQQSTNQTNERTNELTKRVQHETMTRQEVKT